MTQEQLRQDYMDAIDVLIRQKLAALSARVAEMSASRPPSVYQLAYKHATLDALSVVAFERWFASNPPHIRRLPHVLLQRGQIVDRAIEPRALTAGVDPRSPLTGPRLA